MHCVHLLTLATNSVMFLVVLVFFLLNPEKNLSPFYCKIANVNRFHSLFCSKEKRLLVNLAHFLKFIMSEF